VTAERLRRRDPDSFVASSDDDWVPADSPLGSPSGSPAAAAQQEEREATPPPPELPCRYFRHCGRSFATLRAKRQHEATSHKKGPSFVCDYCREDYGHRQALNRHLRAVHRRDAARNRLVD